MSLVSVLKKMMGLIKMKKLLQIGVGLITVAVGGVLFTNLTPATSYDGASLVDYYQAKAAKCLAANSSSCEGEVIRYKYERGPDWGLMPPIYYGALPGVTFADLFDRKVSQQIIYRNTGAYVTNSKNPDAYGNYQLREEYSYAYNPVSGVAAGQPMRSTKTNFFYATDLIPGNPDQLSYNVLGVVNSQTIAGVGTNTFTYNTKGQLTNSDISGIKKDYGYDSAGNIYTESNWKGSDKKILQTLTNYKCGSPQKILMPNNKSILKVISDDCSLQSETDRLGYRKAFTYDENFMIKSISYPLGDQVTTTWVDLNKKIETRGTIQDTTTYDVLGREILKSTLDLANRQKNLVKSQTWDDDGRLIFKSLLGWNQASAYGELKSFDVLDRVQWITRNSDNASTGFEYRSPDQVIVTKPTNYKTRLWFRNYGSAGNGLLIKNSEDITLNAANASDVVTTEIVRDPAGRILQVIQNGVVRKYIYNANNLLAQKQDPESAPVLYSYYPNSELLKEKKIGSHPAVQYFYDDSNRLQEVRYNNSAENISYDYNDNDGLIKISSNGVVRSFDFDGNGNKKTEAVLVDGHALEFNFEYDSIDTLAKMRYPDYGSFYANSLPRNIISLSPDAQGRPTSIIDNGGAVVSSVTYNPNGMFKTIGYANGVNSALTLTEFQWPLNISVSGGSSPLNLNYSYDLDGNVKTIDDLADLKYSQSFTYDGLSRLTTANYANAAPLVPAGSPARLGGPISYDAYGNITRYTQFAKNETAMNYDPESQLLRGSNGPASRNYSYDDEGQMTSNSEVNLFYNDKKNLIRVSSAVTGENISNYVYDAGDIRVKKVTGADTTYYMYINNKLLAEVSSQKGISENFYLGQNLAASRNISAAGVVSYKYHHFNPVSSTIAVSKPDRSLVRENYNSYGDSIVANPQFTSTTNMRYAGHMSDDESGLVYMGARYYDPKIGRFLTPDPAGFSEDNMQSFNKYLYGNNNPHKFIDPNGKIVPLIIWGGLLALDAIGAGMSLYDISQGDYVLGGIGLAGTALGLGAIKPLTAAAKATSTAMTVTKTVSAGATTALTATNVIKLNCVSIAFEKLGFSNLAKVFESLNVGYGEVGVSGKVISETLNWAGLTAKTIKKLPEGATQSEMIAFNTFLLNATKNGESYLVVFMGKKGQVAGHVEALTNGQFNFMANENRFLMNNGIEVMKIIGK